MGRRGGHESRNGHKKHKGHKRNHSARRNAGCVGTLSFLRPLSPFVAISFLHFVQAHPSRCQVPSAEADPTNFRFPKLYLGGDSRRQSQRLLQTMATEVQAG
jgi:hypothetical protein